MKPMKIIRASLVVTVGFVGFAAAQPVNAPVGPPILCTNRVVYDTNTNGSTELVAAVTGRTIYVCGYNLWAGGTAAVDLRYGTGTACATNPVKLTPAYALTTQTGISDSSAQNRGLIAAVSNALCINASAGVAIQAVVYYSQF